MLKGLGVFAESLQVAMPIFPNHLQVTQIAADIRARFKASSPTVPGLLIRNHGVTVWATSQSAARNYIELVEYIFRYIMAARLFSR